MRSFLFSSLILLFSINSPAQEAGTAKEHRSVVGYMMYGSVGYAGIENSSLHSIDLALTNHGYAPAPNNLVNWSISPMKVFYRNHVFDMEINGFSKRNAVKDTSRTTVSGSFTKLSYGYCLVHSNSFFLYPSAGVNLGSIDIHSHQQTPALLNDVSASNHFVGFDLSLNADVIPNLIGKSALDKVENPGKLFTGDFGITVGYSYSPFARYWNDNNIDVYNKVSNNVNFATNVIGVNNSSPISFFYVKVRFGAGMLYDRHGS